MADLIPVGSDVSSGRYGCPNCGYERRVRSVQSMPPESPGGLTEATYLAIAAFILQANGGTAGPQALTTATAIPLGTILRAPAAAAAGA